jgi:hypothetical protein
MIVNNNMILSALNKIIKIIETIQRKLEITYIL